MNEIYEVLSPLGGAVLDKRVSVRRLDTLAGKTVCEVSNGVMFRADETFPMMRDILKSRYPDLTIVPYTDVPTIELQSLVPETKAGVLADLRAALTAKRCDAVIAQFAG